MKIFTILALCMAIHISLNAQETIGKLSPGQTYTNQSNEVIFYMPQTKVVKLLNYKTKAEFDSIRVEKYKDLIANMELRIIEADSAIGLRNYEAQYWKMQLEGNDRELEQERIQKETLLHENDRIRRSRVYYLLAGVVATSIVYISLN